MLTYRQNRHTYVQTCSHACTRTLVCGYVVMHCKEFPQFATRHLTSETCQQGHPNRHETQVPVHAMTFGPSFPGRNTVVESCRASHRRIGVSLTALGGVSVWLVEQYRAPPFGTVLRFAINICDGRWISRSCISSPGLLAQRTFSHQLFCSSKITNSKSFSEKLVDWDYLPEAQHRVASL